MGRLGRWRAGRVEQSRMIWPAGGCARRAERSPPSVAAPRDHPPPALAVISSEHGRPPGSGGRCRPGAAGHIGAAGRLRRLDLQRWPARSGRGRQHRWPRRYRPWTSTTWTAPGPRAPCFGPDGTGDEIDLTAGHAPALRQALARYVPAGRRAGGGTRRPARSRGGARASGPNTTEVREWAKAHGIDVKDRGRVPAEPVIKFKAATGK